MKIRSKLSTLVLIWAVSLKVLSAHAEAPVAPKDAVHAAAAKNSSAQAPEAELKGIRVGEPRKGWSFRDAGQIPVQASGRTKPLDSYARELMLFETGSRSFQGWDPVDLIFSWISAPGVWQERQFIQISREDVKKQLGLDIKRSRFSPKELYQDSFLAQYAERLANQPPAKPGDKTDPREQELKRVLDRIGTFRNMVSGAGWPVVPVAGSKNWKSLAEQDKEGEFIRAQFADLVRAYYADDRDGFERSALLTRAAVEGEITGWDESARQRIQAETLYNRVHPFLVAWILYLVGAFLWMGAMATANATSTRLRQSAWLSTGLALLAHIGGFGLRCFVAGRPPVTNMYESIIWVSLGAMVFAMIIYVSQRQMVLMAVGCVIATLGLIAADAAPAMMDPGIHPLVPVLRSNYWLTIHVLTITLGYAAFALTLGIGNVTLFQFLRRAPQARIMALNQLTYRAMAFGVVLLGAGTILGGIWADYSWGRFWGWDPKEVWALIAFLGYVAILHARFTGWIGQFGYAAWTVISFLLVLMAWYGVNFVLGVGLHSYGFSSGGQGWVALFVAIQMAYVGAVALMRKKHQSESRSEVAPATP